MPCSITKNSCAANMNSSKKKNKCGGNGSNRFLWNPESTNALLKIWMEKVHDLQGTKKNTQVHKEMAVALQNYGPNPVEIKTKMDNMTKKYKHEAASIEQSGGIPSKWEYFERVEELLVGKGYTCSSITKFEDDSSISDSNFSSVYMDGNASMLFHDEDKEIPCEDGEAASSAMGRVTSTEDVFEEPPPKKFQPESNDTSLDAIDNNYKRVHMITFGELVTNELEMLHEDLLIEAKRKIYNIICDMQAKQFQRNGRVE